MKSFFYKIKRGYVLVFIFLITVFSAKAQERISKNQALKLSPFTKNTYISLFLGTQMSGMKNEDFVAGKFAPYIQISAGKWITPFLSVSISYQGPYFRYLADNFKHKYFFLNGDLTINLIKLFNQEKRRVSRYHFFVEGGLGYFYNDTFQRPLLGLNGGLINGLTINKYYDINLKIGGIVGWKIYQEDEDILPNISLGVIRKF